MQDNASNERKRVENSSKKVSQSSKIKITAQNALVTYNTRDISINARIGVDPRVFFQALADFKLSNQQLEALLHISSKTIQNKIEKNVSLGPVHSEHLLKLQALYLKGVELFRTVDEFNHWLNKPFWFSNEKPADWLVTPGGIDAVMDELIKMAYGDAI